ncbi:MAG: hydrolase [Pedosphaera sp.]|nr:hydrolase [Pedosphaera sp.]
MSDLISGFRHLESLDGHLAKAVIFRLKRNQLLSRLRGRIGANYNSDMKTGHVFSFIERSLIAVASPPAAPLLITNYGRRIRIFFVLICLALGWLAPRAGAGTFLFDATKAEMAGNADWVIDADLHNLTVNSAAVGSGVTNSSGNESNPQRYPTPPASGITASTAENYWTGALSAWAVGLVKHGHSVETLPYDGRITWNDPTNPQDLTNYQVYVLVEPNIYFTAAEKTAIINFVQNGGGLFMVSDHSVADRNNDGSDAYQVLNDLMTNSVANNPFGISYNGDNISVNSTNNTDSSLDDPIVVGPAGTVSIITYHNGSTMTVNTNQNPTARVAVWRTSTHATNNALIAYARHGKGKVVAYGDSSCFDDGTGDPNDINLFVDYPLTSVSDGTSILNAALWLATPQSPLTNAPVLTNPMKLGDGSFQFSFTNLSGASFTVFASTNVALPFNQWSNLGAAVETPANSGNFQFTDPQASGNVQRFYRVTSP